MKTRLRLAAALAAAASLAASASALCIHDLTPPCQSYWGWPVVFVGTVREVVYTPVYQRDGGDGLWNHRKRVARITVETPYKGIAAGSVEVVAEETLETPITFPDGTAGTKSTSHTDCDYKFEAGVRYVVYAARSRTGDGTLVVGLNRTRPLAEAAEDLEFLRDLPRAGPGGRIYGKVLRQDQDAGGNFGGAVPVAGVRVTARGPGREVEAVTDAEGRYALEGLEPGAYRVGAALPKHLSPAAEERDARVAARGCVELDFRTSVDGRVEGRVLDAEGRPVPSIRIDLAPPGQEDEPRPKHLWAYTDEDGRYELRGVPPGRYVLGFRLDSGIDGLKHPYPRTYYPGTQDPSAAAVVELEEGEKLKGYDLKLPPPLAERAVEGVVVWPDGSPVAGAYVSLGVDEYAFEVGLTNATTDAQGRFKLRAFEGLGHVIRAHVSVKAPESQRHAEPVGVPAGGAVTDLRIVITEPHGNCPRCWAPRRKARTELKR